MNQRLPGGAHEYGILGFLGHPLYKRNQLGLHQELELASGSVRRSAGTGAESGSACGSQSRNAGENAELCLEYYRKGGGDSPIACLEWCSGCVFMMDCMWSHISYGDIPKRHSICLHVSSFNRAIFMGLNWSQRMTI